MKKFYSLQHSQSVRCKFSVNKALSFIAVLMLLLIYNNRAEAQLYTECTPTAFGTTSHSSATEDFYITTATLNSTTFYSGGTFGANPYTDLSGSVTMTVVAGQTYTLTLVSDIPTAANNTSFGAWADWTNNGTWTTIMSSTFVPAGFLLNVTSAEFTVPGTATGSCRIRVQVCGGGNVGSETNPTGLVPCPTMSSVYGTTGGTFNPNSFGGEVKDFNCNIINSACSGAPSSFSVSPSSPSVCPASTVNVAVNDEGGTSSGYSFQWMQSNSASGPWVNAVGGSNSTTNLYTTPVGSSLPYSTTYYMCNVTCGANTTASAVATITENSQVNCPSCQPAFSTGSVTTTDQITSVVLNGNTPADDLNMSSGLFIGTPFWETINNTATEPDLTPGSSYTLTVKAGSNATTALAAWMDFNNDGSFNSTAVGSGGEFLGAIASANHSATGGSFTFTVPSGATAGVTRMRVIMQKTTAITAAEACTFSAAGGAFVAGEALDFFVNIIPACTPPTVASGSPTAFATTPGFTDINITNFTTGGGSNVLIVARQGGSATSPTNTTTYTAATGSSIALTAGQALGTGHIIYNGAWTSGTTSVDVTGLASGVAYTFDIYDYTGTCYAAAYTPTAVSTTACTPPSSSSGPTGSAQTNSSLNVAWAGGGGANTLVVARIGGSATAPTNGFAYTGITSSSVAYPGTLQALGTGVIVYNGTGNSGNVTLTGLTINTTYSFDVYSYNTSPDCYATVATGTVATTNVMTFVSSTTTQTNTSRPPNSGPDEIVGLQVVVVGATSALSLSSITFNTSGSTNAAGDILDARIYSTGTSSTFATTTLLATITGPSGAITINGSSSPALTSTTLSNGTNYFWIAYDITSGATLTDFVDAAITTSTIGGTAETPTSTTAANAEILAATYCTPACSSCCSFATFSNIQVTGASTLNYAPTSCGRTSSGYSNYASGALAVTAVNLFTPSTNAVSLTVTNATAIYDAFVWIDLYNDGTFTDPGDLVCTATGVTELGGSPQSDVGNIVIPSGVTTGNHLMRIRLIDIQVAGNVTDENGCSSIMYAETEDYMVNIETASVPMTYVSSTTAQASTANVALSSQSNAILQVQVVTAGPVSPLTATSITFNTNASAVNTNIADITNARLYYTGGTSTFSTATATQVGSLSSIPSGSFTLSAGSQTLTTGTNYFWLTYDIPNTATSGDLVAAQCNTITLSSGAETPTLQDPGESRTIGSIASEYCIPSAGSCSYGEITNFTVGTLNNNASGSNCGTVSNGYSDYTSSVSAVTLASPSTNAFSVTDVVGGLQPYYFVIWLDENNDGIFENSEIVYELITMGHTANTVTGNIVIPSGVSLGLHRLRIRWLDGADAIFDPCTALPDDGQAQDYMVNIGAPCSTPTISVGPTSHSICTSGSGVVLTANCTANCTGIAYTWTPSTGLSATAGTSVTANPTSAGTYTYTVTGTVTGGCTATATSVITVNTPGTTVVSPTTANPCSTDVTPLSATGMVTYSWLPSATLSSNTGAIVNATPSANITYTVTGTDANNCTSSATSIFTVRPVPIVTVTPTDAVCTGQLNATLTASGNSVSYTWAPNTFLNTTTGSTVTSQISVVTFYTVTGTGSNGCTANGNIVPVATIPSGGTVTPTATVICSGGTTTLTCTNAAGHDYQWQISPDNVNWTNIIGATGATYTTIGETTKQYYRQLANSNACYDIASTTGIVDISVTPIVTITSVTSTTATVTWTPYGSGQYNISWSGNAGSGSASALTSNTFVVGQSPTTALISNEDLLVTITPATIPACGGVTASSASTHTLCAAPTVTNVSATASHGFIVDWDAVTGATAYRVYYRDISNSTSWSFVDVTGGATNVTIAANAATYAVYVAAKNCPSTGNIGDASTPVNYVTTNPVPACGPVPTVSTVSNCPNQITVSISGSGPPYNLILRRISPSLTSGVSYPISTSAVNVTVGTQYAGSTWEIFATQVCGPGSISAASNISDVTVKPACPVVNNLVLSHPTCNGFTASWNTSECAGLGISKYELLIKRSNELNYAGYPVSSQLNDETVTWEPGNTTYDVVVMAVACNDASSGYSNEQTISSLNCGREAVAEDANSNAVGNTKETVTVYPNPAQNQFNIDIGRTDMEAANVTIELINQLGQVMQTSITQVSGGHLMEIMNVGDNVASGLYFVRTSVGGNVYVNRIVISRE